MRRFCLCAVLALLFTVAVALVPVSPASGAAPVAETASITLTGVQTVTLTRPAAHVAVYWVGSQDAHVTLAFSADGTHFDLPVDAGRDDTGEGLDNGLTYGAVHAAGGAVAVRITTDVPLQRLTVVAIPGGDEFATGLVAGFSVSAGAASVRAASAGALSAAEEPLPPESSPEEEPPGSEPLASEPLALELGVGQPVIVPRAGWGADPAYLSWAPRFYPPTKVIVHHTSDGANPDGSPESYAKLVRAIYYYHAITQDWGDIAYNYLIDPLGTIYEGRYSDNLDASPPGVDIYGNAVVGGHTYSCNTGTVGIAVLGTYRDKPISAAAQASLEQLLAWIAEQHGIDPAGSGPYYNPYNSGSTIQTWNIAGHLDYRSTDCPGAAFYKALPSIRQNVFGLTGPVAAPVPSPTYLIVEKSTSSPVVGQQVTITATLTEQSSRTPLAGRPVTFAVGGIAAEPVTIATVMTNAKGVASVQVPCTTAEKLWVSAGFDPGVEAAFRGSSASTELSAALGGLKAVPGDAQVQLSWKADPAASGYNVYRNGKKANSAPVAAAGYVDTGLTNGATYTFQVTAIVNGRESAKSASVEASPRASAGASADNPGGGSADGSLFSDVPVDHPYYAAVEDLGRGDIINGAPDGLFHPSAPVTRQQFAKMIVLGGGYPVSESDVSPFKDVTRGGPATLYPDNYVAVCVASGITRGKTATTFDPYTSITRAQVMTMVVRAAQDFDPSIIQEPSADWKGVLPTKDPTHGANIARAEYSGLLSGIDLSAFSVTGRATRGEIAQIIWNLRAAASF